MKFSEFKSKVMNQLGMGQDPEQLQFINQYLPKLSPAHQSALMALVLENDKVGLTIANSHLLFAPIEVCGDEKAVDRLLKLLEVKEVDSEQVEKILKSPWIQSFTIRECSELAEWVIAYFNLRKRYASLVIDALHDQKPFTMWRQVAVPMLSSKGKPLELKPLLIRVLRDWPTSGRSGYAYLENLKAVPLVQSLMEDNEVAQIFDEIEGRCDFGSLEKVRAALKQGE